MLHEAVVDVIEAVGHLPEFGLGLVYTCVGCFDLFGGLPGYLFVGGVDTGKGDCCVADFGFES